MTVTLYDVLEPVVPLASAIIAGAAVLLVKRALAWLEQKKVIDLTAQQVAIVNGAVDTASGMILHDVTVGAVQLKNVNLGSSSMATAVAHVTNSVPGALAYLGVSQDTISNKILASVTAKQYMAPSTALVPPVADPAQGVLLK